MANTLDDLMPKILARGLIRLRKRLVMPMLVNRDFSTDAARRGATIDVPVPPVVQTRAVSPGVNPAAAPDLTETTVPIPLDQWHESPIHFTDKERLEIIDEGVTMAIDAAADALAEKVNGTLLALYKQVYNNVGTAGTTPFASDYATATAARKLIGKNKAPLANRYIVLDPDAEEKAINLAKFADTSFSSDNAIIIEGEIGRKLGMDWFMDQQVSEEADHTAGSLTGDPTVSGAHAAGVEAVTIATDVDDAVALNAGDIINFAGDTQDYVVLADADVGSSSSVQVSISPKLQVALSGGEAVSLAVSADHVNNLAFHQTAFALAVRPFRQPASDARVMTMVDDKTGLPLRLEVSRQNKQDYWSFDLLWGIKAVRPELAVRVLG